MNEGWVETSNGNIDLTSLSQRVWSFGVLNQKPYGKYVRLLPDGRIGGYIHRNEKRWELNGTSLLLRNIHGMISSNFDRVFVNDENQLCFVGPSRDHTHVLEEYEPLQKISPKPEGLKIICGRRPYQRRNLVIVTADEQSLHPTWSRNISDEDRTWDLCVSFYGTSTPEFSNQSAEYFVSQPRASKLCALHRLMHADSEFWKYDRFWFPDDDLDTNWRDINELFEISRTHDLFLTQPALHDGFIIHDITRKNPKTFLRYTSFVEGMAPLFSNAALRICVATFDGVITGWGVDHIWPKLLGEPSSRIAIVDGISVIHTRPYASRYNVKDARKEEKRLLDLYGLRAKIREFGAIYGD